MNGKHHLRIILKDIFGFVQCQEKGTFGLGYKLTLTGNSDNAVLNKDNATIVGKFKINAIEWCVNHIAQAVFDIKLYILSHFSVKQLQSSNM